MIVGGVTWDAVVNPLMDAISPWMAVAVCMYIAFCVFALMNMATGVFVDRACRQAQEDRDINTANHISQLFFSSEVHREYHNDITWNIFKEKMETPDMQEFFKEINVDPSEVQDLFHLLDSDASGSVDAEELVNGCLRLRGQAKALELSLLMHDVNCLHRELHERCDRMEHNLGSIMRAAGVSSRQGSRISVKRRSNVATEEVCQAMPEQLLEMSAQMAQGMRARSRGERQTIGSAGTRQTGSHRSSSSNPRSMMADHNVRRRRRAERSFYCF
jgi:hypothetical protein